MAFDEDSGLVYEERVIPAKKPRREASGGSISRHHATHDIRRPSTSGTRCLRETAIRNFLCNLGALDIHSLEGLPYDMLRLLWQRILDAHLVDMDVWQVFAQSPMGRRSFVYEKHVADFTTINWNPDVFESAGGSMAWLTTLTLCDFYLPSGNLASVAKLRNVRYIYIGTTEPGRPELSDSSLHSWADSVETEGAFSQLELLFVDGQQQISYGAFHHLSRFPDLHTFVVQRCGITIAGYTGDNVGLVNMLGWRTTKQNHLFRLAKRWSNGREAVYTTSLWFTDYVDYLRGVEDSENRPMLNLKLGYARRRVPWDRKTTICFERDWRVTTSTPEPAIKAEDRAPDKGGPRKKRKIKDSKAVALDALLGL